MSYIVAPFRKVKTNFHEFLNAMVAAEAQTKARANTLWPGFSFGGLLPQANQYGLGNILPKFVTNSATVVGSNSWLKRFSAPGSFTSIFSYTVPTDQIHTYAGIAFPDPHFIFNAIKITIADRNYPIFWVEEARAAVDDGKGIAIIFKPDQGEELVVAEKTSINLQGYQERGTSGITQRAIPLGLAAYRKRDDYVNAQTN